MVGVSFNQSYIGLEFGMFMPYYSDLLVFLGTLLFGLHYSLNEHSLYSYSPGLERSMYVVHCN